MSNLNNLTSKIIATAEAKKEEILASAKMEKQATLEKYEAKAKQESISIIEKAKKDAEEKQERMISNASLKVRDNLLQEKQEKIHEVFQLALQQLKKMDEPTFNQFLKKAAADMDFQGEVNLILGEENPVKDVTAVVNEINTELSSHGKKVVVNEETRSGISGFILEQNGVEINCSFEALVHHMEDVMEYEVATALFN